MIDAFGACGLLLLLTSWYFQISFTKSHKFFFYFFNFIASILLTIHAVVIKDYIFMIVNSFIAVISLKNIDYNNIYIYENYI
jgi:hypothetical protein